MASKAFAEKTFKYLLTLCVLAYAAYSWYQHAWTFEDSFITFRVIDNFLAGYGLRWNIAERVQVFTHPLWLLLLTPVYAFTREVILTTAAVSAICTLATVAILYRGHIYRSSLTTSVLILTLFLTNTFPTYSSSGFENPLTHLLASLFCVFVLRGTLKQSPFVPSLVAALGMVTRLDTALFYLPTLLATCIFQRQTTYRIILGLLPLFLWELFSLLYYGVLIPNTALAKIPPGMDTFAILRQGWGYLADLLSKDIIASAILAVAFLHTLLTVSRATRDNFTRILQEPLFLLNLGTVVYCAYIVRIGGDYLSYRFWSMPLLTAAIAAFYWTERIDSSQPCVLSRRSFISILCIVCAAQFFINKTSTSVVTEIADDRWHKFFAPLGLPIYISNKMNLEHPWRTAGLELRERAETLSTPLISEQAVVGLIGYHAGPRAHIVDTFALADPLLARLPVSGKWRIGHFPREVPPGYVQWLAEGDTSKLGPVLGPYLQALAQITREPIFSLSRLRILIPFALGFYDRPLKSYLIKHVSKSRYIIPLSKLSRRTIPGIPWDDFHNVNIPAGAILEIVVDKRIDADSFDIAVDCDDTYTIDFLVEGDSHFRYRPGTGACPGMVAFSLPVPSEVRGRLVKSVLIYSSGGDGMYSIGHFIFNR